MAFEKICTLDEGWEGEMAGFTTANGTEVLLIGLPDSVVRAVQQTCPHQEFSLADGILDRRVDELASNGPSRSAATSMVSLFVHAGQISRLRELQASHPESAVRESLSKLLPPEPMAEGAP